MAIPDDRVASLGRRITGVSGSVVGLLGALPEIAAHLKVIRRATLHMDDEVTGMHAAVEELRGDVAELQAELIGLRTQFESLDERLDRLGAQVDSLAHPFRRRPRGRELPGEAPPDEQQGAAA
jgi:chromosome segregation ATPase